MQSKQRSTRIETPLLRVTDATLRVNGEDVFAGTHWTFHRGEHWAVVGANGSGKSTLLRALRGELPVCRGDIEYGFAEDGKAPLDSEFPEDAIAFVSVERHRALVAAAMDFHQARWSPYEDRDPVTATDVLLDQTVPPSRRALRETTALLGIEPLMRRRVETLSNGEMRKVLLAQALLAKPKLLVLDNPFAGLDQGSRRRLKKLLDHLMERGLPILLATQRIDELPSRITHVLWVEDQRVKLQGPKRTVLRAPGIREEPTRVPTQALRADFHWRTARRGVPRENEPIVEMHRANVAYDGAPILRDVSWTVRHGENWVLRGPNGSGKSTLLSLVLADHPQAYANDIRLLGVPRGSGESIWDIKRRIGWLAPELQFHYSGEVTGFEVVCSGLYDSIGLYRDSSARETRAMRRWMRHVGIAALEGEPFGALSDGLQRLVLLARALVKEPPLLILDEPCQGLDAAHRHRVLDIIDGVARQPNVTVIYVTHHPDEIPASFTHELLLNHGRVTRRR
jgi:molybdate transport system ATP-binding protein